MFGKKLEKFKEWLFNIRASQNLEIEDLCERFEFGPDNSSWIVIRTKSGKYKLCQQGKIEGEKNAKNMVKHGGQEIGRISGVSGKEALYHFRKLEQNVKDIIALVDSGA